MGIMDPDEREALRGIPYGSWDNPLPRRKMTECLACGETFPDDDIEADDNGSEICPRCYSDRLRKLS